MVEPTRTGIEEKLQFLSANELFSTLDPESLKTLAEATSLRVLEAGEVLMRQGDVGDAMYLLIDGMLRVLVKTAHGTPIEVGRIIPGTSVGEMQVLIGGDRTATVEAIQKCRLLCLSRSDFDKTVELLPNFLKTLTEVVHQRLIRSQLAMRFSDILGPLDAVTLSDLEKQVEWVSLKRGDKLFEQGDPCDGWYIVASGRLKIVRLEPNGSEVVIGEVGRGESLGEMALFTGDPRMATPYAVRDTTLIRIAATNFEELMLRHPRLLLSITHMLIKRLRAPTNQQKSEQQLHLAIIPIGDAATSTDFAKRLNKELSKIGNTLHLNAERLSDFRVLKNASEISETHPNWLRFGMWLDEQSASHRFVILEGDPHPTGWTRKALSQADLVLLVADASADKKAGVNELALFNLGSSNVRWAQRKLILVHPPDTKLPSQTREWLQLRPWIDAHHHVRAGSDADAGRIARILGGCAVGLALGGGGARGFAHIGAIKALKELGIPIDFIGGTSMGSIIAGQYALGFTVEEMIQKNKEIIATKPFTEYTIPMIALLKTVRITQSAKMSFRDVYIEDLWINYFAISSNLTTTEMVIHETGYLWQATRASGALPGIVIPVVQGGHLLVDGGVVNNLPGDVMREKCGGGPVIAVNVSPEEDLALGPDGLPPSQWKLFWNRMLPFRKKIKIPGVMDILMRTTMLASASRTHAVKRSVDLYVYPPVDGFGMLEFEKIHEIIDVGYQFTLKSAAEWTGPKLK